MFIGEKIKLLREEHQLSQEDMAKSLHVSYQAVSNWERGKSYPDISNIIMISDLYSISLDELIREDTDYKEVLLEKKLTDIIDLIFNSIFLFSAFAVLIYMLVANKLNESTRLYLILSLIVSIHTSINLSKAFKKYVSSSF